MPDDNTQPTNDDILKEIDSLIKESRDDRERYSHSIDKLQSDLKKDIEDAEDSMDQTEKRLSEIEEKTARDMDEAVMHYIYDVDKGDGEDDEGDDDKPNPA